MERINPPKILSYHVRSCKLSQVDSLSELGIYSVIFTRNTIKGAEILENRVIGQLLRTKASHFNEGGVATGYAVVDQPFIVPVGELTEKSKGLPAGKIQSTV